MAARDTCIWSRAFPYITLLAAQENPLDELGRSSAPAPRARRALPNCELARADGLGTIPTQELLCGTHESVLRTLALGSELVDSPQTQVPSHRVAHAFPSGIAPKLGLTRHSNTTTSQAATLEFQSRCLRCHCQMARELSLSIERMAMSGFAALASGERAMFISVLRSRWLMLFRPCGCVCQSPR